MRKDEEGALGGEHPHPYAGQLGNVMPPDAAGIDGDGGVIIGFFARLGVAGMDTLDGVAFLDEAGDFRVQTHLAAVHFGVQHVGGT